MNELLEPLTPADCDLRDFAFMPLDVARLMDSSLFARSTGDEFKAAVALWCKAWMQVPAGSLPNDPRDLAYLSGSGPRWGKVKAMALHGWVACSDGRLYHPVVAEKANDAWAKKLIQRERSKRGNEVRWGSGAGRHVSAGGTGGGTESSPDDVPGASQKDAQAIPKGVPEASHKESLKDRKGQGEGQGQGEREKGGEALADPPRSAVAAAPAPATGSRLPDAWQPSEADATFARSLALDPSVVAEQFRDFWRGKAGKDGRKADWPATWRVWCRREAQDRGKRGAAPKRDRFDMLADAFGLPDTASPTVIDIAAERVA